MPTLLPAGAVRLTGGAGPLSAVLAPAGAEQTAGAGLPHQGRVVRVLARVAAVQGPCGRIRPCLDSVPFVVEGVVVQNFPQIE